MSVQATPEQVAAVVNRAFRRQPDYSDRRLILQRHEQCKLAKEITANARQHQYIGNVGFALLDAAGRLGC